ncbi:MAG: hypothetical protein HY295_02875 [Thaumarchaeota archaeon]|nr:hypothetical protein [Nitrososphaerota archaeon]
MQSIRTDDRWRKGDCIKNENIKVEGYIVDNRGRIRGEARRYDPYARFGEIMLYEIDSFGYVLGYISKNWHVMSEDDMLVDKKLTSRLAETKYQIWKRHNIIELREEYEKSKNLYVGNFERFCRDIFRNI